MHLLFDFLCTTKNCGVIFFWEVVTRLRRGDVQSQQGEMYASILYVGMEEIDSKYKAGYKLVLEIRDQLEQLEAQTNNQANPLLEGRISTSINELSRISQSLEKLVAQQNSAKKELWRM